MPNKIVLGNDPTAMSVGHGGGDIDTNTAVGKEVFVSNTTGIQNTAVGFNALYTNGNGSYDVAIGYKSSLANTSGSSNVAIGAFSLEKNTTAIECTACGFASLYSNSTGILNTAHGSKTLYYNSTGTENVAIGAVALFYNDTGSTNTACGLAALYFNTSGYRNSAYGRYALFENTVGINNVAIGNDSQHRMNTGNYNTSCGEVSLYHTTNGSFNSAFGRDAGTYTQSGAYANWSGTTCLGTNSRCSGNNQVQLGDSSTTTYAYGAVQNRSDQRDKADIESESLGLDFISALRPVTYRWDYRDDYFDRKYVAAVDSVDPLGLDAGEYPLVSNDSTIATATIDADGRVTLSQQTTYDTMDEVPTSGTIEDLEVSLRTGETLDPIPKDGSKKRNRKHHGLIAQELVQTLTVLGIDDFAGLQHHLHNRGEDVYSIGYTEFIAPLIKAVQELKAENDTLKTQMTQVEDRLSALESA